MIDFYDAYKCSLNGMTPLDSMKYDKEFGYGCIRRIRQFMIEHQWEYALVTIPDGKKNVLPQLVQLVGIYKYGVELRYKTYDENEDFRQYLHIFASYTDIYCKSVELKVFGGI